MMTLGEKDNTLEHGIYLTISSSSILDLLTPKLIGIIMVSVTVDDKDNTSGLGICFITGRGQPIPVYPNPHSVQGL
jgi:hypothetical protein